MSCRLRGSQTAQAAVAQRVHVALVMSGNLVLDFDGVLNGHGQIEDCDRKGLDMHHWDRLDPEKVVLLERILVVTQAAIVVSSSWRGSWNAFSLERGLRRLGAPSARVIGVTPDLAHTVPEKTRVPRWHEVSAYFAKHPCEVFAILEDAEDMGPYIDRTVRPDYWTGGLELHDVERAIALLTKPAVRAPTA